MQILRKKELFIIKADVPYRSVAHLKNEYLNYSQLSMQLYDIYL
jgi:hypothetical protein